MVCWQRKMKKKHWLKRPKAVPEKTKFRPKYKWFKTSYLEFFFKKYYFGHTTFYIRPYVPVDIIKVFLISHFLAEILKANKTSEKDRLFYEPLLTWHWKQYTPAESQKPFWLYKFSRKHVSVWCQKKNLYCTIFWRPLHSWSTLKASVCIFLYISATKSLFQRSSKTLPGWGLGRGDGETGADTAFQRGQSNQVGSKVSLTAVHKSRCTSFVLCHQL